MLKRNMMTLGVIGLLTVGETGAMKTTNPDTVARISGIIQDLGFQKDSVETRGIILDALQGVVATDEEISEAFRKIESQGKKIPKLQGVKELTPIEKENAYKMWLMKQAMEKGANEGTLPEVPRDVQNVIGGKLHELSSNPVLNGKLIYTMDNGEKKQFNIMDLVKKDGSIDLSNKDIFGDASKYLLITTDPEKFFDADPDSERLVILIAPKFLIEEKIRSSAKPFEPIMAKWNDADAPIGIFYRIKRWDDLRWYNYVITAKLAEISKAENNLFVWSHGDNADGFVDRQSRNSYLIEKFNIKF